MSIQIIDIYHILRIRNSTEVVGNTSKIGYMASLLQLIFVIKIPIKSNVKRYEVKSN